MSTQFDEILLIFQAHKKLMAQSMLKRMQAFCTDGFLQFNTVIPFVTPLHAEQINELNAQNVLNIKPLDQIDPELLTQLCIDHEENTLKSYQDYLQYLDLKDKAKVHDLNLFRKTDNFKNLNAVNPPDAPFANNPKIWFAINTIPTYLNQFSEVLQRELENKKISFQNCITLFINSYFIAVARLKRAKAELDECKNLSQPYQELHNFANTSLKEENEERLAKNFKTNLQSIVLNYLSKNPNREMLTSLLGTLINLYNTLPEKYKKSFNLDELIFSAFAQGKIPLDITQKFIKEEKFTSCLNNLQKQTFSQSQYSNISENMLKDIACYYILPKILESPKSKQFDLDFFRQYTLQSNDKIVEDQETRPTMTEQPVLIKFTMILDIIDELPSYQKQTINKYFTTVRNKKHDDPFIADVLKALGSFAYPPRYLHCIVACRDLLLIESGQKTPLANDLNIPPQILIKNYLTINRKTLCEQIQRELEANQYWYDRLKSWPIFSFLFGKHPLQPLQAVLNQYSDKEKLRALEQQDQERVEKFNKRLDNLYMGLVKIDENNKKPQKKIENIENLVCIDVENNIFMKKDLSKEEGMSEKKSLLINDLGFTLKS